MTQRELIAWLIHFYTMAGGVVATLGLFDIISGNANRGFLLIIISRLIDGTDGLMARRIRIREILPEFDGSNVDNLIDIFTYLWIPIYVMWAEELLPHAVWVIPPIIGTLFVYGHTKMKSQDKFFVRFPALWGGILIYMYYLEMTDWVAILTVMIFSVLCFIPLRYLYPSQNKFLRKETWILSLSWVALWLFILITDTRELVWVSLYFPVYYLLASFYASYKFRHIPL